MKTKQTPEHKLKMAAKKQRRERDNNTVMACRRNAASERRPLGDRVSFTVQRQAGSTDH